MPLTAPIGRRAFLRAGGMSAALVAVARLRVVPIALAAPAGGALPVLSPADARVLGAIAARVTATGDAAMPRFADTAGMARIDAALRALPAPLVEQLSWALWLFEYGPPLLLGKLSTFTGLEPQWQDAYLLTWEDSRFQLRRMAFQAVKNLSYLGYYADDATWKGIGYSGPWTPQVRVAIGPDGWPVRRTENG